MPSAAECSGERTGLVMSMTALLVSDSPIGAEALGLVLEADGRVRVVGVTDAENATRRARSIAYEVVLIDLPLPHGTAVAKALLLGDPDTRIVANSVVENEHDVLAWAQVGVLGCVGKSSSLSELVVAIEAASKGERSCSHLIGRSLFGAAGRFAARPSADRELSLTARESEVIQLLTYGWSNKQIARALRIELATVKNHLHNTYRKLGVHSRSEARQHFQSSSAGSG
jgi:DNA-binding NarL/FixJ family response regulator